MGSASHDDASQKEIEGDLIDTGNRLLRLPSSTDELLILLEKAESLLAKVWQQPPRSTCHALVPAMKALLTDEVLKHVDETIQIAVASCFNELTRITAPDPPYSDDQLKEFFRLFMTAFKHLSSESGPNYSRARQILEITAKVRSSLMLLDIDTDGLTVEMFEVFLNTIRSDHTSDVFKYMEMIMTMVIEESDDISSELLTPLLASVKMDNNNTSPMSWELGKKIFENCATKLQQYLRDAVKQKNLDIADYAEIVTSLCHDASNGKNMVSKDIRLSGEGASGDVSSDGYNEEKDSALPLELGIPNMLSDSSQKEFGSVSEVSLRKRGRSKKKQSMINQNKELEFSSALKRKILQAKVKCRGSNIPKKTGKSANAGSSTTRVEKEEGVLSDSDMEGKNEVLPQEQYGRKEIVKETSSQKHVADKMVEFPISKPAKSKYLSKGKEKKSRRSRANYGEELVNLRIQVWWPMDEMFYAGTVKAYDPVTKKHTIIYDDDEVEILNLRKETWELFDDEQPPQTKSSENQETIHPSPAKEPLKIQEKTAKRKTGSSRKQLHPASSKRSKTESHSVVRSGESSAPDFIHVNDEPDNETRETNVSLKDDGDDRADKEESETLMNKMEPSHTSPKM